MGKLKLFDSCIILAGGRSRRMGFDKAFIKINGTFLIELLVTRLKGCFKEIIVTTSRDPGRFEFLGVKVVKDDFMNVGPIGGLHAGLKVSTSLYNYLIACDMPVISTQLIKLYENIMLKACPDVVACSRKGFIEPFHAVYSKKLVGLIKKQIHSKQYSLFRLIKNAELELIDLQKIQSKEFNMFSLWTNLNCGDDIKSLKHNTVKKAYESLI